MNEPTEIQEARKRAAGLLARATVEELLLCWNALDAKPTVEKVRGPETGLVMVRGKIGGGGSPFNLGEATVTRATVKLASGTIGHAHALGTSRKQAWYAAIADALWQEEATRPLVEREVLSVVASRIEKRKANAIQQTAATRVDFFTMVRGDD
ncbi:MULTISPECIES: phosphonate C-P lyase system protein PhnG [Agrobacterium]|uniref:Alpha-D-ribose 1-methylphosphonate 5-triphosphate synthase subunit PhnG n=1 Tax=Agrobacterium larrymoorei TaxID=160699 RepID=A0AAJ2BE17_9HYPH|nr:phosphonate C-P lyase system protein PhnG [Agrobacterium larrymoorei]MDQ1197183.1 alpha-D-ribose 1-methylphosphonate 5-triphosphate synthase subunit PhnG [Rhizobium sp. SORGH_AS_0787]MDR6103799.1 alpha-D-ribose 1-methylphosphonate 5-triphosphate synthase subunit PhnG [Agrobacterium larrymoorei]